jgi:hypothetical protein
MRFTVHGSHLAIVVSASGFGIRHSSTPFRGLVDSCPLRFHGEFWNHGFRLPVHATTPLSFEKLSEAD